MIYKLMARLLVIAMLAVTGISFASNKDLNLYIWSGYIPPKVVKQFESLHHVKVNISYYDNNETLFAKLSADPHSGYDLIMPSGYYIGKMIDQHMLRSLDMQAIPNFKYINSSLKSPSYDRQNRYSIAFDFGVTGILVNKRYWNPATVQHWRDLWQPRFQHQLLMINDMREVFGVALLKMGLSINSRNPEQLHRAYEQLRLLMRNIKLFNSDGVQSVYIDDDATIGIAWNGDAYKAMQENPNLRFILPKEGFSLWVDCLSIPRYAPHPRLAEQFINFLLEPKIAKQVILYMGFSSADQAGMDLLPKNVRDNRVLNPLPETLKRAQIQSDIGLASAIYERYWELLKLGASD